MNESIIARAYLIWPEYSCFRNFRTHFLADQSERRWQLITASFGGKHWDGITSFGFVLHQFTYHRNQSIKAGATIKPVMSIGEEAPKVEMEENIEEPPKDIS